MFKVGHCSQATDAGSIAVERTEVQGKEKEAEETRRIEEETRKVAEEEKVRAEFEKKEALKKEEIAVQKKLEETSPERKRVLGVEADVHKQKSFVATLKDELITVGTENLEGRARIEALCKDAAGNLIR
ncbi:hypothetical protein LCGC14_1890640, partial [marine sediment metagenome]